MKKVLILSYFYPPGNFAGSYRVKSWVDYFPEFGYFPVLVTRHWNPNETDFTGISREKGRKVEKKQTWEFHYLPFKGGLRDRFLKLTGGRLQAIGRLLSFFEIIMQNYFIWFCPYKNLYNEARQILLNDPEIELVIASGRPFYLFKFCYRLKKEFNYIDWIADYRDPWTTNPINQSSIKMRFLAWLERPLEKKWVGNALKFTTCSSLWVEQISQLTGVPGFVSQNGFDDQFFESLKPVVNKEEFTIIYNGTLYDNQRIEVFVKGFIDFIHRPSKPRARLIFAGAGSDPRRLARIKAISLTSVEKIDVLPKMEQPKVFELLAKAHLCVLTNYDGEKGRHTAKLFDYLASQKPIVLCPSDNDVMEALIRETNSGFTVNSSEEAATLLSELYVQWEKDAKISINPNVKAIRKYSRKNQAGLLCGSFDAIAADKQRISNSLLLTCPLCENRRIKRKKGYEAAFLIKCQHCGFVFSGKIPTLPELAAFYESYTYDENYYSSPLTRLRYARLLDEMEPYRQNNRLLDVGCGNGDFLMQARERGWECWGTEFSDAAVNLCKAKGLKVLKGTLEELNNELPTFDIITSFEVLEHILTPRREVDLTIQHLRTGGLFYVTTPNFNSLMRYLLGHRYDAIIYPEHLVYFTPESLTRLLKNQGFEKKRMEVTGFSLSRFRNSLFGMKESPFTPDSLDERFRLFMEKHRVLRALKNSTDQLFTTFNAGLAIKAWFEKKS